MNPRVGVGVFVFRDGKFLMGKRKGSHGAGTWSLAGGHLEYGESFEQTARREVYEETGMNIRNVQFAAVTNDVFTEENKHYVTIWVTSDWESNEPVITEPDRFVEQQWFDFESLPGPLFLAWQNLLPSDFILTIKERLRISRTV